MPKPKKSKKSSKKVEAPVLGSPNHVFQENHDKEAGKKHGLRNNNNNNTNTEHKDTSNSGKNLNVLNSESESESGDSLYGMQHARVLNRTQTHGN